jgi:hypothetical protein
MRLIKLMAYLLFGYALYEFVRGVVEEPEPAHPAHPAQRSPQKGSAARKQSNQGRAARQTPAAPH